MSTRTSTLFVAAFVAGVTVPLFADAPLVAPAQFKAAPIGSSVQGTAGPSAQSEGAPWWGIFRDRALERLEQEAITANQDLRQSVARIMEARAQARAAESGLFPTVTVPLEAMRQRSTNTGPIATSRLIGSDFFPTTPGSNLSEAFSAQALTSTSNDFQAPLAVGYEIDVFGRIRHAYAQARADARASLADRQAIRLSLTAQVAANYFALRAADSEVAALQRALQLRGEAVQIQQQRVKGGSASDIDLLRARVEQDNTEADLADAVQQRVERENALAELCGQFASDFHLEPQPLEQTPPPAIPVTIPAQVLSQRPDLVEAEQRIVAAGEGVKAARAQFLPTFKVLGDYGYESAQSNQLIENQSHIWSIAGAISIPIFDGGRNAADLAASRARTEQALGAYRQTALAAIREVEDALSNLRQRTRQADARQRAAADARRVFAASQRSYNEGAMTYFEVIDAQRALLNAELAQVQTLNARYAATIDLIRATGGGFTTAPGPDAGRTARVWPSW